MTENTTTSVFCACGRPAAVDPFGEFTGACGPHLRVRVAEERVGGWTRAHEALSGRIYDILDHDDPGPLENLVYSALDTAREELARAHYELDVAARVASHRDGDEVAGRPRTLEEVEKGYRMYLRVEGLDRARDAVLDDAVLKDGQRWGILAALYGIREEAAKELHRVREGVPTA
jgi:hypothetical protein